MKFSKNIIKKITVLSAACLLISAANAEDKKYVYKAGHPSLKGFLLGSVQHPENNQPSPERIALGKSLFFDPRLSGEGNMSCASCHNPGMGWSDGLPTARGVKSSVLRRATPTILNTGHNSIQMWDGSKKTLEDQVMGPMRSDEEMNMDISKLFGWLNANEGYKAMFAKAYPGEPINESTLSKAVATFQRTVVSNNSPFDKWVKGEAKALTTQQVDGFKIFMGKANCVACHSEANFTDNGFHNLGLASFGNANPDMGRHTLRPLNAMKGAFKTPTVREVARTAPYFHDGSAKTLMDVVEHYDRGGDVTSNLSPNIKPLNLTKEEKLALVAFMQSLSSPYKAEQIPELQTN
jgi:cytochrome c peroxidase